MNDVTPSPTSSIIPEASIPNIFGNFFPVIIFNLPFLTFQSAGFTAANFVLITTSPGPATGFGISEYSRTSGPPYLFMIMDFII